MKYDIDLKSLHVFDSIMRKGSRQLAESELDMNQGKIHYHLEKMRNITGDTLFERENNKLQPTPFAISLYPKIKKIIGIVNDTFNESTAFDFTSEKKHFCILCNEYFAYFLAHHILERLEEIAPEMSISFEVMPDTDTQNALINHFAYYESLMASEKVALSIFSNANAFSSEGYKRNRIFRDQYVYVHSKENADILGIDFDSPMIHATAKKYESSLSGDSARLTTVKQTLFKGRFPQGLLSAPDDGLEIEQTKEHFDLYQYWHINNEKRDDHRWLRKFIRNTCKEFQV